MKKILSALLAICMLLALVACGAPAPTPAPATTPAPGAEATPAPVAPAEPLVLVSVVKAIGSNWFDSMDWEGKRWAEENGAVHHYIGPTSQDSAAQLQCIEDAIALQPDILTVVPIAADACDALLKQARDQGVLVVTHEGVGLTNVDFNVDAFSNQQFGESFAIKCAEVLGNETKYACVVGTLTTPAHMAWAKAFYAYAEANTNMTTLNDIGADGIIPLEGGANSDSSYSMAKQFIQANPDLEAFWVGSSSCVAGVCRAIEELGLGDKIKVFAVGTASGQKQYYESGTIPYGSFWYPGYAQYACFELGKRMLEGTAPKTGDDLMVEGYHNITVDGINVYGQAWLEVTLDNLEEMCEML